jgi:hypothetical protein
MMKRPRMIAASAGMIGALLVGAIATSPVATAAPAASQLHEVGLLAPRISFTFGGQGTLGQFGASVGVNASYKCSQTLDSPILPQLLGSTSSLTFQFTEDIGHNGTETITEATRTITDLTCNGRNQEGVVYAATDAGALPLLSGDSVAVVTMSVCDLLGCTVSSDVGVVTLG